MFSVQFENKHRRWERENTQRHREPEKRLFWEISKKCIQLLASRNDTTELIRIFKRKARLLKWKFDDKKQVKKCTIYEIKFQREWLLKGKFRPLS